MKIFREQVGRQQVARQQSGGQQPGRQQRSQTQLSATARGRGGGIALSQRRVRRRTFSGLALALATVGVLIATPATALTTNTTGAWSTETIAGMSVQIYTPVTAPALAGKRALMVNLHGCIQKNTDLQMGGNWVTTADRYGMVVAIPAVPAGGVIAGCWDYYDSNHSRTSPVRDDGNLIDLASALEGRAALGIDPAQVYLSGLSSGGGETMVMGCLAPDIFAGIGINAGPTVGTTSGQIGSVATTQSAGTAQCRSFAAGNSAAFDSQLTSVVYGNNDTTVAPGYNTLNAQIMAGIYGAAATSSFSPSDYDGINSAGDGMLYSDATGPRVSIIQNTALGHNWPAGAAPGGLFISALSIDYPAYVTGFFFANNRRVTVGSAATQSPPCC